MTLRTRLKGRLHRLGGDDRAVSPVVGFVLIFALIIIVFTLYQTNVVPAQNTEIEFKHGQAVQTDLNGLNDAIKATSADGTPRSQTIETGVQYPSRALAINPGPPVGLLRTQDEPDLELDGIDVPGSAYWDDEQVVFDELKSLSYSINYKRKQQDPSFSVQNGLVTKGYDGARTLPVGGDSSPIVSNRQINLYLLGGDYKESAVTASPTVKPISTSTEYLQFESSPDTEIPIDRDLTQSQCEDKWKRILGPGYGSVGGSHPQSYVNCDPSGDHIIKFQSSTQLSIRITKVGFGDVDQSDPLEVVPTEASGVSFEESNGNVPTVTRNATLNRSKSFTVAVRDKFGNPVSDTKLTTNESNVTPTAPTTNDEGKVTFSYTPGETGSNTIAVEIDGTMSNDDYDTAKFRFDVTDPSSGDGSGDGDGDVVGASCSPSGEATLTIKNTYDYPLTVTYDGSSATLPPHKSMTQKTANGKLGGYEATYQDASGVTHRVAAGNLDCTG